MSRWQGLKMAAAPLGWRLLGSTVRLHPRGLPAEAEPAIYACLHRDILPAILFVRPVRPVLVVSHSPDGEILVRTLGEQGYGFVRGATGEGGGRAFVELRRLVENGASAGLAVDGPRGPFGCVHDGVLQLARLTGRPVVGLRCRYGAAVSLGTWDRTRVPWPGSRVHVELAPPVLVPREAGAAELASRRESLAAWLLADGEGAL